MLSLALSIIIVMLLVVIVMQRVALIKVRSARALRRKTMRPPKGFNDPTKQVDYLQEVEMTMGSPKCEQDEEANIVSQDDLSKKDIKEDVDVILGLKTNQVERKEEDGVDIHSESAQMEDADVAQPLEINNTTVQVGSMPEEKLELVCLYVQAASGRPYGGYELLQALLSAGLRYGDMNIFHRYEKKTGRGAVLFSLASAVSPGSFDLSNMGGFSSPGLTLFFKPASVKDPMIAFEDMLHTAGQLVDDLGGVVLDEDRNPLIQETVREVCLKIKSFQTSQKNMDLFEQV